MKTVSSLPIAATVAMAVTAMVSDEAMSAGTRGITVQLRANETANAPVTGEVKLYGSSHALVIGIDRYDKGWPKLSNAVKDARVVARELRKKGFQVILKTDLTGDQLDKTLKQFFAVKGSDPDARLLLWYAGHGHTVDGEGFLVPADAPPATDPTFLVTSLHMRDFGGLMRLAKSKHVLSVFDSCFSGTIFQARSGAAPAAITRKTTKPVRQFLTSGDAGQQVRDDGSFRELFVRAIRGDERADVNADGYLTGEELGLFLSQRVTALTSAAQTPKHGKLHDVKFDQGDFVFVLPGGSGTAASPATATTPGSSVEVAFWQSIQGSNTPADFEDYLAQFPNGAFSSLARRRLEGLKQQQVAAVVPPRPSYKVADMDEEMAATKNANVRAQPTTKAEKIGRLNAGTKVGVTGRTKVSGSTWYRVALAGNRTGYVFGTLLEEIGAIVPPTPTPVPSPVQPVVGVYPMQPGTVFKDCPECPEMVVIPAGSYRMGDLDGSGDSDEKPVHTVTIPHPFAVGKYEVTQEEWQAVMGSNPSRFKESRNPVEDVNWNDTKEFVGKLSAMTGKTYRLLSEAEWEYVARANSSAKYWWGDTASHEYANYGEDLCCVGLARGRDRWKNTSPVGQFAANGFGLHDLHGNVWEWTEDCWHDSYSGAPTNGRPWTSGGDCGFRVLRGGSWYSAPKYVRSALRDRTTPANSNNNYGLRVARTLD